MALGTEGARQLLFTAHRDHCSLLSDVGARLPPAAAAAAAARQQATDDKPRDWICPSVRNQPTPTTTLPPRGP